MWCQSVCGSLKIGGLEYVVRVGLVENYRCPNMKSTLDCPFKPATGWGKSKFANSSGYNSENMHF